MISRVFEQAQETCQVCVIGSGAAGSVLASELAGAGLDVIVLEEGDELTASDFTQKEGDLIPRIYADNGARANHDASIPILQGRCVGGTTVINHGICFRTPERVLDEWKSEFGIVGMGIRDLEPYFERVEQRIGARILSAEEINANNRILQRGCERLGLRGSPMTLNIRDCSACGPCNLGCPEDRKGSTLVNYLPEAVRRGARIFRNCHANRIEVEGSRTKSVRAKRTDKNQAVTVNASVIIVAAGAVNSPALLLRSGLGHSFCALGLQVSLHPLIPLLLVSDTPLNSMKGVPHSFYCDAFFNSDDDFLLEGLFVSMGIFASGMGGFGGPHRGYMKRYPYLGLTYVQLRDRSRGLVRLRGGHPVVDYAMNDEDQERTRRALKILARICLAGGAAQVATSHVRPVLINSTKDIAKLDAAPFRPNDLTMFSAHPQGGCPMGENPRASVVNSLAEVHGIQGLFVCDSSVFPSPIGTNPMVSIMALASLTAERIVDRRKTLLG